MNARHRKSVREGMEQLLRHVNIKRHPPASPLKPTDGTLDEVIEALVMCCENPTAQHAVNLSQQINAFLAR